MYKREKLSLTHKRENISNSLEEKYLVVKIEPDKISRTTYIRFNA
jgi:hypothetical protein